MSATSTKRREAIVTACHSGTRCFGQPLIGRGPDLLTEDFQDGRTLGGVTFIDPFKGGNARLLAEILP